MIDVSEQESIKEREERWRKEDEERNRKREEKAENERFMCHICSANAPDLKSILAHHDSKHPNQGFKLKLENDDSTDRKPTHKLNSGENMADIFLEAEVQGLGFHTESDLIDEDDICQPAFDVTNDS